MKQPEVSEAKEQAMMNAALGLSALTDAMVHELPPHAQSKLMDLLTTGARLVVNAVMVPYPIFTLLLLPEDPADPAIELVQCSPSADTILALKRAPVGH